MTNNSSFNVPVTTPSVVPPDPSKRVNYTQGMVLGVDDFDQEFAYLSDRIQWLARDLIGYGTVCGLRVNRHVDGRPRIVVSSGVAVSPQGQKISVSDDQCAYLEDWLGTRAVQDEISQRFGSPPVLTATLNLYVVLCYRGCPTEKLPIAGEPCRSDEQVLKATRIQDDFQLELRFESPEQTEEDALRDFVGWLASIPITDTLTPTPLAAFEQAIRDAAPLSSPIVSPFSPLHPSDFMIGSPPASLVIPVAEACDYLRTAFRIWTTELRPRWRGIENGCNQLPDEECVLLAEVHLPINSIAGRWQLGDLNGIEVDERRRPFLVHLRLIQEWLLCSTREDALLPPVLSPLAGPLDMGGDVLGTTINATVEKLRNIPVLPSLATPPINNQVLSYDQTNQQWVARTITEGGEPIPELLGDVTGNIQTNTVKQLHNIPVVPSLATPPANDQVLSYDEQNGRWVARTINEGGEPIPELLGDVTGNIQTNTVRQLHNIPVVPSLVTPPTNNQVLSYDEQNGRWVARTINEGSAGTDPQAVHHEAIRYDIVAAGVIGSREPAVFRTPRYNELRVEEVFDGGVLITFKGYTPPDETFMYIVKALPVAQRGQTKPLHIHFGEFTDRGFTLLLPVHGGRTDPPWTGDQIKELNFEFMIEVSRYEAEG